MYKRSLPSEAVEETSQAKKLRMQDGSAANGASKIGDGLVIDEDLHSRQLAVYGRESMRRMAASNVLIVGALGLGVEVGKEKVSSRNIIKCVYDRVRRDIVKERK